MRTKKLGKRILISITGVKKKDWQSKLAEINRRKIKKVALFLSAFPKKEKKGIYDALLKSCIKKIPLVHLRGDMNIEEVEFLIKNFKTKYFTIHENYFKNLKKWGGYYKKLFLELNYDNKIDKKVNVNKIGGFCVDLSHFKAAEEKWSEEFLYVLKRRRVRKYFKCNHLNGYSYKKNEDIHTIKSLKEFDYLKTLPKFVFGKVIAIEVMNPVKEQIKFKKHVISLLKNRL